MAVRLLERSWWLRCGMLLLLLGTASANASQACLDALRAMEPGSATAPRIRLWTPETFPADWAPPPCGVGSPQPFTLLLEGVARYRVDGGEETLLERFARVSALTGMHYWSVTRQVWRPLVVSARALVGPKDEAARGDFTTAELLSGRAVYHFQEENTPAAALVYRTRVLESSPAELVVEVDNALPVTRFLIGLFDPGAYRFTHVFQRDGEGMWLHYLLLRMDTGYPFLLADHADSFINRMGALFRYVAGAPSEQWPPVAPGS